MTFSFFFGNRVWLNPYYNIARALVLSKSYWAIMNKNFMYARPCSIKWRVQFHFSCKISVEFRQCEDYFEQSKPYFELLTSAWQRCLLHREHFDFGCHHYFHWVFVLCLATLFLWAQELKERRLSFLNFLFSLIRRSEFFIDNFRDQGKRFRSTVA